MHLLSTSDSSPPMTGNAATKIDLDALAIAHGCAVFRAAFRVTGDRAQPEDIQQNVFVRLIEKPPRQPIENQGDSLPDSFRNQSFDAVAQIEPDE